jgi:hypothetical protein
MLRMWNTSSLERKLTEHWQTMCVGEGLDGMNIVLAFPETVNRPSISTVVTECNLRSLSSNRF